MIFYVEKNRAGFQKSIDSFSHVILVSNLTFKDVFFSWTSLSSLKHGDISLMVTGPPATWGNTAGGFLTKQSQDFILVTWRQPTNMSTISPEYKHEGILISVGWSGHKSYNVRVTHDLMAIDPGD